MTVGILILPNNFQIQLCSSLAICHIKCRKISAATFKASLRTCINMTMHQQCRRRHQHHSYRSARGLSAVQTLHFNLISGAQIEVNWNSRNQLTLKTDDWRWVVRRARGVARLAWVTCDSGAAPAAHEAANICNWWISIAVVLAVTVVFVIVVVVGCVISIFRSKNFADVILVILFGAAFDVANTYAHIH